MYNPPLHPAIFFSQIQTKTTFASLHPAFLTATLLECRTIQNVHSRDPNTKHITTNIHLLLIALFLFNGKTLRNMIWTSKQCAKQLFPGQNTQQTSKGLNSIA